MSAAPGRPKQARSAGEAEGTPVSAAPGRPKQARSAGEAEVAAVDAACWDRLAVYVEQALGLAFAERRRGDLQRMFAPAVRAFGFDDAGACIAWLVAQPPTRQRWQELARHLAIGETYFFRDAAQLDALRTQVLAPLIAERRDGTRRLRLWSAACSTGEEAYTLAMLVQPLLGDDTGWQVEVLGTDVRADALAHAAEGVYGPWSFRGVARAACERFFTALPGGRLQVVPEIRRLTRFAHANLVGDLSLVGGAEGFDLVVCRNVLMYFGAAQAERAVAGLRSCLRDGGWLVLGASEWPAVAWDGYARARIGGADLLRRSMAEAAVPASVGPSARPMAAQAAVDESARIRALADRGCAAEALQACEAWLQRLVAPSAEAHHLHAMILQEQGACLAQVRDALQRALRCAPGFVLAHFALGHLARREGRGEQAGRHFATVQQLLSQYRPEQAVPGGEGMTAAALAEAVAALALRERPW